MEIATLLPRLVLCGLYAWLIRDCYLYSRRTNKHLARIILIACALFFGTALFLFEIRVKDEVMVFTTTFTTLVLVIIISYLIGTPKKVPQRTFYPHTQNPAKQKAAHL